MDRKGGAGLMVRLNALQHRLHGRLYGTVCGVVDAEWAPPHCLLSAACLGRGRHSTMATRNRGAL